MHQTQRRVLLVEDDEDDYILTRNLVDSIDSTRYELVWCRTFASAVEALETQDFDVALIDYRIGAKTGIEFVEAAQARGIEVPMILLTGLSGHEIDLAASEAGAADYLNKDQLEPNLLERALRYACTNAAARRSLAERSGLLQTTLDNAGSGLAALDAGNALIAHNSVFGRLIAKLNPQIGPVTLQLDKAMPDDAALQTATDEIIRFLANQGLESKELTTLDDRVLEVSINRTDEGGSVVVIRDITRQRAYEQNLTWAKEEAEAASRSKTAFLATISHELRTPLNAIIGFSEIIMSGARGDTDLAGYKEDARTIHDNGHHLLIMVNEILEFAQAEAGDYRVEKDKVDLQSELEYFLRRFTPEAETAGLRIEADARQFTGAVFADSTAFRRIVSNILSNAIKFTPEGGEIGLSACRNSDGSVSLIVTDTGCGISQDDLKQVRKPFYQVQDSRDRAYDGMGLGLAVADSLVKLHHAEMEIASTPGQGTTVSVRFPANSDGADENAVRKTA